MLSEFTSWPVVRLVDTLEVIENGSRPVGGVGSITYGIPSLGAEHLTMSGGFDFENIKYIPPHFFNRLTRGVIRPQDVLLVKDGATTGKVAFVGEDFPYETAAINEHLYRMRPNKDILEPEYLFFFLYSEWGQAQIQRLFQGAAIGGINQSIIDHMEIPVPPLEEQKQLIKMLRNAKDGLYGLNRLAYAKLQAQYASLFYHWFGSGQPSDEYPETVKLKELLAIPLASGFSPNSSDMPPGIPVFSLSAITKFGIDESQVKYYTGKNYQGRGSDLQIDDLLITRSNTQELVGRVGRYRGKPPFVIYPDLTIRIRLKDPEDSPYVENFLRSQYMTAVIKNHLARGTSGSMKKISQSDINEFDILWPPEEARRRYVRCVRELDQMLEQELASIAVLELHFQSFLARSFTGEQTRAWREKSNQTSQTKQEAIYNLEEVIATGERIKSSQELTEAELDSYEEIPMQPNRAVRASLDEKTRVLLESIEERYRDGHIYNHSLQLRSSSKVSQFKLSLVEVEERLSVLSSLGFILLTQVEGRQLYRLVRPIGERALFEDFAL